MGRRPAGDRPLTGARAVGIRADRSGGKPSKALSCRENWSFPGLEARIVIS
jgi:hypothetical protein